MPRHHLSLFLLGLMLMLTPSAGFAALGRAFVYADGELVQLASGAVRPSDLLAEAGVSLSPGDAVLSNGMVVDPEARLSGQDPLVVQVLRANRVRWDGAAITTTAPTVAAALWEAGQPLRMRDGIEPAPQAAPDGETSVQLVLSRPVWIRVGGGLVPSRTAAQRVGQALQDGGVSLQGLDYSVPPPEAPVPDDGDLQVVRVTEEILVEQVTLPFETLFQPAPDLEIDQQQVAQVGQFGLEVSRVRVRYEDGVEVSRVTEAAWTAAEPRARILGYGTNIVVRTLDTPQGALEYWRAVPAFATSYSPCRLGVDACGSTTASGLPLKKGVVGVIRPWYNAMVFSQVYVEGYGVGVIADIGAGISGQHWIDLGYSDDDWVSWARTVTIYFLTPVPPEDQILWFLP